MEMAQKMGLTGKEYIWVACQTIVGDMTGKHGSDLQTLPIGMLGE